MKILLINQYFWPDVASTSQVLTDLAHHLTAAGHEVHALCSQGQYDPANAPADDPRRAKSRANTDGHASTLPRYEVRQGIHIHRLAATSFGKKHVAGRVLDYLSFHAAIGLRTLLTGWRYDVVITLTTPPLVGLYGSPLTLFSRTKHVAWCMDLHPDCEFELGMMSRRAPLPRLLDFLNGLHFRLADATVALGPYMKQRIVDKGVAPSKVHTIPVWGLDNTSPDDSGDRHDDFPATNPLARELGLEGKFVVMYAGNAGLAHTFDSVCHAAAELARDERIVFLFVGGGRRVQQITRYAQEHALSNIRVMGYFPRHMLRHSLALGDVHLTTLRPNMAGVAVPSKLYGVMAASRPSIFVGPLASESADAIRDANAGIVVAVDDAPGLVHAIRTLADDATLRATMGQAARRAYEQHYNAKVCCDQLLTLLESLSPGTPTARTLPQPVTPPVTKPKLPRAA